MFRVCISRLVLLRAAQQYAIDLVLGHMGAALAGCAKAVQVTAGKNQLFEIWHALRQHADFGGQRPSDEEARAESLDDMDEYGWDSFKTSPVTHGEKKFSELCLKIEEVVNTCNNKWPNAVAKEDKMVNVLGKVVSLVE